MDVQMTTLADIDCDGDLRRVAVHFKEVKDE
jgi:hypothetical protein